LTWSEPFRLRSWLALPVLGAGEVDRLRLLWQSPRHGASYVDRSAERYDLVPGQDLTSHAPAGDGPGPHAGAADTGQDAPARPGGDAPARLSGWYLPGYVRRWLVVFTASLGLFILRFLVAAPVGQADNHDGPRLMCGVGVRAVVPHGYARWFSYAYFEYVPHRGCAYFAPYPSSQLVPLQVARLLTPVLGLPGTLNLIALGLLTCVIASFGIASLAIGLRLRPWAQLVVAACAWLIMADAAFFDVYASPFSEPAALIGLLLVAAGVVYLGRGRRATVFGLVLAGSGGLLAALAKEQYLVLAVPICLTLVLAGPAPGGWRGLRRFRTRQVAAAVAAAGIVAAGTGIYWYWDSTSAHGAKLHHAQAVDMIFTDIVTSHDSHAVADLRALGLPASWAGYAGHNYWYKVSARHDPLFPRYAAKLSDGNIAHFLLTHPGSILSVGQRAAVLAQQFRVTVLGSYAPSAGHPPGAIESRVAALTWLVHLLPPGLGLLWLVPLWAAMAAVAIAALALWRGGTWHRDGAVLVLCMTGCAAAAFIPPAYFAGISTTRHMVGMNLATALAFLVSAALAASLVNRGVSRRRGHSGPVLVPDLPGPAPWQSQPEPNPRRTAEHPALGTPAT
jgi:hypothetical protein